MARRSERRSVSHVTPTIDRAMRVKEPAAIPRPPRPPGAGMHTGVQLSTASMRTAQTLSSAVCVVGS